MQIAAETRPLSDHLSPAAAPSDAPEPDFEAIQSVILAKLDEDKAEDVVVASGRSARHVSALADHLQRALKDAGFGRAQVEGLPQADWVLIDAGDVIVHLFRPEVRNFYQIEKIWSVDSPHRTPVAVPV